MLSNNKRPVTARVAECKHLIGLTEVEWRHQCTGDHRQLVHRTLGYDALFQYLKHTALCTKTHRYVQHFKPVSSNVARHQKWYMQFSHPQ